MKPMPPSRVCAGTHEPEQHAQAGIGDIAAERSKGLSLSVPGREREREKEQRLLRERPSHTPYYSPLTLLRWCVALLALPTNIHPTIHSLLPLRGASALFGREPIGAHRSTALFHQSHSLPPTLPRSLRRTPSPLARTHSPSAASRGCPRDTARDPALLSPPPPPSWAPTSRGPSLAEASVAAAAGRDAGRRRR